MSISGKFQRNYRLDIFTPEGDRITIQSPLSIEFTITRNTRASANKAYITLYNLGLSTRSRIFKDRYSTTEYFRVILTAGYGRRLHTVFTGNILEAYSYRDQTEWVTVIDAYDGLDAIQNSNILQSITRGTPLRDIARTVIQTMTNAVSGALGSPVDGELTRGNVLAGRSTDVLSELTDGQWFIDLETVNVLANNEVLPGLVTSLDPSTLLQTPRRRDAMLEVVTLFEPQVQVAQIYDIRSLEPIYNGQYIVIGFNHDVVISSAQNGQARTTLTLDFGTAGIREVQE